MGALCTPGTMVLTRPPYVRRPASAVSQRQSLTSARYRFPSTRTFKMTRHQPRVHSRSPARPSPSPVAPGRNEDPSAYTPGSAPRSYPQRTPGRGPAFRARTGDHVTIGNLHDVIHSPHATSCRTRTVLPSMARTWRCSRAGPRPERVSGQVGPGPRPASRPRPRPGRDRTGPGGWCRRVARPRPRRECRGSCGRCRGRTRRLRRTSAPRVLRRPLRQRGQRAHRSRARTPYLTALGSPSSMTGSIGAQAS